MAEGDYREVTVAGVTLQCAKGWELVGYCLLEARSGEVAVHLLVPGYGEDYYLRVFSYPARAFEFGAFVSELQARVVLLSTPREVLEKYGRKGVPG